ncbi:MAG: alpha-galactosidase, partial [Prevotellaceae bacterium]|nr:alpha-galactosidase [Prevotellaceae bacterium]
MNKHTFYRSVFGLLWLAVLTVLPSTRAVAQVNIRAGRHVPDVETWIRKAFARGKMPPFSFVYNGQPSASFIKTWLYEAASQPADNPDE